MSLLQAVHTEFRNRLSPIASNVWLAGGCVRDHLMEREPKDFDLFVPAAFDAPTLKRLLGDLHPVAAAVSHAYEPFLRGTFTWRGFEVQVMSVPGKTLTELVSTFDWNVSLFAFDGELFDRRTRLEDIGPGKPLMLHRVTYAMSTLRRGFRFSERFRMELHRQDILRLCALSLADAFKGADKARKAGA